MIDRLTHAGLERARARIEAGQGARRRSYLVHPKDAAHLEEHDGGKAGCYTCVAIWAGAQPVDEPADG